MRITGDHIALTGVSAVTVDSIALPTGLIDAGPWGLLVAVVALMFVGMFRGWIVPKPHYDTLLARAVAAEEANIKLSERAAKLTETNAIQASVIEKNIAVGETVTRVMNAIQEARITSGGAP